MNFYKPALFGIAGLICLLQGQIGNAQTDALTDARIGAAVESRLLLSTEGKFHHVDTETKNGIVKLSGAVDNLLSRKEATNIADSTRGVRDVVNAIYVKTAPRSNKEIGNDIQAVIHADPATDASDTRIAVGDGVVVLTGTATSYDEKQLVEELAAGVTGVKRIQNDIEVRYTDQSSDEKVLTDVIARLRASNWVDESHMKVRATKGAVALKGRVASSAERRMAERIAWVNGTKSVDITQLEVVADNTTIRRRTTRVSDQEVADSVRTALKYNPRVKSSNIGVAVLNGVVSLTGEVPSYAAKMSAARDADDVYGAWSVRTAIRVRQPKAVSDADIARMSSLALNRDPYVDRSDIVVNITNGHAHLRGSVDSATEMRRAENVVSRTRGVVHVANHLVVQSPVRHTPDWKIQQDIEEQLFWSPFVNRGEVTVNVEDGTATLNGTVDTWAESRAASKNATDGGAIRVKNRLRVSFGPDLPDFRQ